MAEDCTIEVQNSTVRIRGSFRPQHVRHLCTAFAQCVYRGFPTIVLDFSDCSNAFPNSMLPTIVTASRLRQDGVAIYAALPKLPILRTRFLVTNWAHYLSPRQYAHHQNPQDQALSVWHYSEDGDHYAILRLLIDSIIKTVVVPRSALTALEWIFSEIMDNVLNHSESSCGGYVQLAYFDIQHNLDFCVADAGRGILKSLSESYYFATDAEAIQKSVQAGVTRNKVAGQGNGLSGSLHLATGAGGWFRILSGRGEVAWAPERAIVTNLEYDELFTGTVVDLQFPYSKDVDIIRILNEHTFTPAGVSTRYSPTDFIETNHLSDDFSSLLLVVRTEGVGHASRQGGKELRIKAQNLLRAEPGMSLVIDWGEVTVIASSFADEFIGKLAALLGEAEFRHRIRFRNLSDVVKQLIDRAIVQRGMA